MTKAELQALEKIFSHDINQALTTKSGLPFQSKSKIYKKLESDGLVEWVTTSIGSGWNSVQVSGWQLTLLGHAVYCLSCDGDEDLGT